MFAEFIELSSRIKHMPTDMLQLDKQIDDDVEGLIFVLRIYTDEAGEEVLVDFLERLVAVIDGSRDG